MNHNNDESIRAELVTEEVEIEGITFTIKPLGPIDLVYLSQIGPNVAYFIKFIVERGTVDPPIEDANAIKHNIILELAKQIQRITEKHTRHLLSEEELENLKKGNKPPEGMVV